MVAHHHTLLVLIMMMIAVAMVMKMIRMSTICFPIVGSFLASKKVGARSHHPSHNHNVHHNFHHPYDLHHLHIIFIRINTRGMFKL